MNLKSLIFSLLFYLNVLFVIGTTLHDYFNVSNKKNKYQLTENEIVIGDQVWMKKNLDTKLFRNGDSIQHCITNKQWEEAYKNKTPAWCYYNNDQLNKQKYGIIYNWYAVSDSRGLAPEGWDIPSNKDWDKLIKSIGGYEKAGGRLKNEKYFNTLIGDDNEQSSQSILSGARNLEGYFLYLNLSGGWWSKTEKSKDDSWFIYLYHDNDLVVKAFQEKGFGLSVRCIKIKK